MGSVRRGGGRGRRGIVALWSSWVGMQMGQISSRRFVDIRS